MILQGLKYSAIVIGASAGGLQALSFLLEGIPDVYNLPIILVQHRFKTERELLEELLQKKCKLRVKQADEKEKIVGSVVYVAPPDYHLLIEQDETFSLSADNRVNNSRPSIDVLFETASHVYKNRLVGIILTGANGDGALGIKSIHHYGGFTIAQNPDESIHSAMPVASIRTGAVNKIFLLKEIKEFLLQIAKNEVYE